MSDLDNPASLWPALPPQEQPEPQRWVWAAMDPADRRARLRELAIWVDWLRSTFELHNNIPQCWYRHPPVVEHLTALYVGWIRTYAGDQAPGRELAEADWINTLHAVTPRLQLAACATGRHEEPPAAPPVRQQAAQEFEAYLNTSLLTTDPAWHPAEAEIARARQQLEAPL
ncbi:hypothetical protein [Streptomyces poriferorum]|uniref:DUF4913 domain-containing protein n=1 Tax=Streptomyces poriferorum TaxID=2798799 RepID=A0ABY9J6N7_9ACTN|nr:MULTISPECIES: hypothetical protein [unclassified Streptomyces]MDP5317403.1 hypothetical protein [Streptomyces sp. Alt4]WLQ62009.1 hypothetical protein P8A19_41785 [Streptomyces sp. Alt2]